MKQQKNIYDTRLVAVMCALVTVILMLFGSASFDGILPLGLQLAVPFAVGALVYLAFELVQKRQAEDDEHGVIAKSISALTIGAIILNAYMVLRSLWINPSAVSMNRFAYENIATAAGFGAIILIFILSTLQKDIYWVTRKKTISFDERQLKERQEVFERSYKIGAFLVLGVAWYFANTAHNIPAIIANDHGTQIPGHLYWLALDVALALFALPLVIAAWRKRR